jgi:signal transduction histidine kinase
MRLIDLPRTTSFRLALLFVAIFGAASLTLFGFLYWQTSAYLLAGVDHWLAREQLRMAELEPGAIARNLDRHFLDDPELERPFALFDVAGHRLSGSPIALPSAAVPLDRPFDFSAQGNGHVVRYRALAQRLRSGDLLLIAQDMRDQREFIEALVAAVLGGGIVTAGLGLMGAGLVGAGAIRRIDAVTLAIQRIVAGDLSGRLPSRGTSDDLDRLVHVVNGMLGEIERLMHEVKSVCDNIAHDLRTPLTRLLAGLERAARRANSAEEYAAAVEEAIVEIKAVLRTFNAMLRISELEDGARRAGFTSVNLAQAAADAAEFYEPLAEAKRVNLSVACDAPAATNMHGDPNLLFEAIANLLDNAIKFTLADGHVRVQTFNRENRIGITVADSGPGIPTAEREAVLRRFYRAETSRHAPGSGLGLPLVAAIAHLHGMDLIIADVEQGCHITLSRRASQQLADA